MCGACVCGGYYCSGVVIGALRADGSVDETIVCALIDAARPLECGRSVPRSLLWLNRAFARAVSRFIGPLT